MPWRFEKDPYRLVLQLVRLRAGRRLAPSRLVKSAGPIKSSLGLAAARKQRDQENEDW